MDRKGEEYVAPSIRRKLKVGLDVSEEKKGGKIKTWISQKHLWRQAWGIWTNLPDFIFSRRFLFGGGETPRVPGDLWKKERGGPERGKRGRWGQVMRLR